MNKIIIHHSGKSKGNSKNIKLHNNELDNIYNFIIDNGNLKEDGFIEKVRNIKINSANNSIGICLIGNLNIDKPTKAQLNSLIYLLKNLKKEFDINIDDIIRHKDLESLEKNCPGKNFNINQIKKQIVDSLEELF